MTPADTLRLRLPEGAARLHARRLTRHPETHNDDRRRSQRPRHFATLSGAENLGPGFGRLQWDRLTGTAVLDFSAKVLGPLYPDGITAANLPEVAVGLNRSGLVGVNADALADAEVQWADVATNIPVGQDALPVSFDALRLLRTNLRHPLTDQAPRGRSLTWKGTGKLKGHNLNAYDWEANLWTPDQRDFYRSLPRDTQRRFEGMVRFERQARGPARVKHYLAHGVREPFARLSDVLASPRQPVAELFDTVRGDTGQRELFDRSADVASMYETATGKEAKPGRAFGRWVSEHIGLLSVCEQSGWEMAPVKDWLRLYYGAHASRLYDHVAELIERHHAGPEAAARAALMDRIDALADALRQAA